jgi:hypothetical protein
MCYTGLSWECNSEIGEKLCLWTIQTLKLKLKYVMTDGQLASLVWYWALIWGPNQIFIIVRPLWVCCCRMFSLTRGWAVGYNCCRVSPAPSFSGPRPTGLLTIFYSVKFETLPTWRAKSPYLNPPGTGWPSYTSRHWVYSTRSPLSKHEAWIFYK